MNTRTIDEIPTENILGEVYRLSDMINYVNGSVVSREILNRNGGTLTLFAFDKGQGLTEHTSAFDAMIFLSEGEAQVILQGKQKHLAEGEVLLMPANVPHSIKAIKRFKMVLIMMR
jgi:quercetin dioxygenase-like cupin family protein